MREQISAFDVDFVITDVSLDFTKTKGTVEQAFIVHLSWIVKSIR